MNAINKKIKIDVLLNEIENPPDVEIGNKTSLKRINAVDKINAMATGLMPFKTFLICRCSPNFFKKMEKISIIINAGRITRINSTVRLSGIQRWRRRLSAERLLTGITMRQL